MSPWLRLARATRATRVTPATWVTRVVPLGGGAWHWCCRQPRRITSTRRFSSANSDSIIEHHAVTCASSGEITVSLHNVRRHDPSTPLIIFIPPFSHTGNEPGLRTPLPSCFRDYPVAAIHYRWPLAPPPETDGWSTPLHWPTPLHDVNFGYSWIVDHLGSTSDPSIEPRHAYIYGSYLGASLATALALTESRLPAPDQSIAIRGLIAHNGIFNWSMFLPDHPIHHHKDKIPTSPKKGKSKSKAAKAKAMLLADDDTSDVPFEEDGVFTELKAMAPALFADPGNLFDPFASACLFFHTPNLHVPEDFTTPLAPPVSPWTAAVDRLAKRASAAQKGSEPSSEPPSDPEPTADEILAEAAAVAKLNKPPRKGYLIFPPRKSPMRIPHSLFLYDTPHEYPGDATSENNFRTQAVDLMGLMMRSVDMYELGRQRIPGKGEDDDDEDDGWGAGMLEEEREGERQRIIDRRVQSCEVEPPALEEEDEEGGRGLGLDEKAEGVIADWLRERIDEDFGGEFDEEVQ